MVTVIVYVMTSAQLLESQFGWLGMPLDCPCNKCDQDTAMPFVVHWILYMLKQKGSWNISQTLKLWFRILADWLTLTHIPVAFSLFVSVFLWCVVSFIRMWMFACNYRPAYFHACTPTRLETTIFCCSRVDDLIRLFSNCFFFFFFFLTSFFCEDYTPYACMSADFWLPVLDEPVSLKITLSLVLLAIAAKKLGDICNHRCRRSEKCSVRRTMRSTIMPFLVELWSLCSDSQLTVQSKQRQGCGLKDTDGALAKVPQARLALWLRHPPRERKIPGSNLLAPGFFLVESYQWPKNWHPSGYTVRRLAI